MCVQRFDDSRCLAIHITYRVSLRSSSLREPRHPLLKVISCFSSLSSKLLRIKTLKIKIFHFVFVFCFVLRFLFCKKKSINSLPHVWFGLLFSCVTDPSAGSPTETLLRLLLPLDDKV